MRSWLDRPGLRPGSAATHLLDSLGQSGDCGSLEEGPQRDLHVEGAAETRQQLDGQERMAAALEETVMSTDRFGAE